MRLKSAYFSAYVWILAWLWILASPHSGKAELGFVLQGSGLDVSTGLTIQRISPSVAWNSTDNEYMVVWADRRNRDTTDNDIFAQRVSPMGALVGSNFPIMEVAESQDIPVVLHNSTDNEYLVGWKTQQSAFFNDVRGRRISNTGALLGNDFFILGESGGGGGGGNAFSMAYNPTDNEYLVTGQGRGEIRGRRVSNTGSLLDTGEFLISPPFPGSIAGPNGQVLYNSNANEYLATWRDSLETLNLQGQRLSANGILLGNEFVISPRTPESGRYAATGAFDPTNNRYLTVFGDTQENKIFGQFVSSSGQLMGTNFAIGINLRTRVRPIVARDGIHNVFLIVWQEEKDIVGQLLSSDGSVLGGPGFIAKGTAALSTSNLDLAFNAQTGEFLVAWEDARNLAQGESDIFAQLIAIKNLLNDKFAPLGPDDVTTAFSRTPCGGAAAGTFTVTASFTNTSVATLSNLLMSVQTLTGGNVLCNADGGPGGAGSQLTVPLQGDLADGQLSPGEAFVVQLPIGLQSFKPFSFLVDVLGEEAP